MCGLFPTVPTTHPSKNPEDRIIFHFHLTWLYIHSILIYLDLSKDQQLLKYHHN